MFSLDCYLVAVLVLLSTAVWKVRFSPLLMDLLFRLAMCKALILNDLVVLMVLILF